MDAVIDTNVLISGLINPHSRPGEIVDILLSGQITPTFDDRILIEYEIVLKREKFSFPPILVNTLLQSLKDLGNLIIPIHTAIKVIDEKDRCFYECSLATESRILITGNKKHFPKKICSDITVLSPKEFLENCLL